MSLRPALKKYMFVADFTADKIVMREGERGRPTLDTKLSQQLLATACSNLDRFLEEIWLWFDLISKVIRHISTIAGTSQFIWMEGSSVLSQ